MQHKARVELRTSSTFQVYFIHTPRSYMGPAPGTALYTTCQMAFSLSEDSTSKENIKEFLEEAKI